jgi:hypothetical protein
MLRFRSFGLVILTLCLTAASSAAAQPKPNVQPDAGVSTPPAPTVAATDVALRWLDALKRNDVATLQRLSRYPFAFSTFNSPCRCEDGKAKDGDQLARVLAELMKVEDVQTQEVDEQEEITMKQRPDWARRWIKKLPKGGKLVRVYTSGTVIYYMEYFLAVVGDQVQTVWVNARTDGEG